MLCVITLTFALTSLLSSRADARLWETVVQAEARFGRPLKVTRGDLPGEEDRKYRWKGFLLLVTYVGGKSENELYMHSDMQKPFSNEEVQSLLKLSSAGKRWDKPRSEPMWYLIDSDGKTQIAAAAYYPKLPRVNAPAFTAVTATYARRHKMINI
jgi:hypothetical protein